VIQEPQLGTGHALLQAGPALEVHGRCCSGRRRCSRLRSVRRVLDAQAARAAAVVVATAEVPIDGVWAHDPRGRRVARIVEHRDATPAEREVREINSGVYVFELAPLFAALGRLGSANAQGEYYLPDLVDIYRRDGRVVDAVKLDEADEIRGINTRAELAEVGRVLQGRINGAHMTAGVTLVDPATAYIGPDVRIGQDTILHPFVILDGSTAIGEGCELHAGTRISAATLGNGVTVFNHSVVQASTVADGAQLGPFARIRPESTIGEQVHSETSSKSRSRSSEREPQRHLAYLGDLRLGVA
jgi:bifunctional UDP-N-acetylglucosamine pyrophosphorylase/glucosamine-1-phosphate N-acetyltransferase